jgi:hypothetical protein
VGAAELAAVVRQGVEDPVDNKGDGELHPHHHADDHDGEHLKCVEHDDPYDI